MAFSFDGTTQGLWRSSEPLGGTSCFVVTAWLMRTGTNSNNILFEYDSAAGFDIVGNAFSAPARDIIRSYSVDTASSWSDTYPTPSQDVWHHYMWIFPCGFFGDDPPQVQPNQVWIDGVQQTLTTLGHGRQGAVASSSYFSIMCRSDGTPPSKFVTGKMAEFAICSSAAVYANPAPFAKGLYAGANVRRIMPDGCVMWVPMLGESPTPDWHGAQRSFTLIGSPPVIPHPPVVQSMVGFEE